MSENSLLSRLARAGLLFLGCIAVMMLVKIFFMAVNLNVYSHCSFSDLASAIWHGKSMDGSVAGYLMALPCLLLAVSPWIRSVVADRIMLAYWGVVSAVTGCIIVADAVLYGYWGFKLDATAVFYFMSSPGLALASAPLWQIVLGVIVWLAVSAGIFFLFRWIIRITPLVENGRRKILTSACMALVTGLLFIPIRGGVTVSTMNPGNAYFSSDIKLNHAALNPAFTLLYSLSHQSDFGDSFRYFNDDEARQYASPLLPSAGEALPDSITFLKSQKPDIYLIILESFSSHLMPSVGGEPIAIKLDSIANAPGSLFFTNFYASSFRTDRGIPSILSGVPAPPTTSLMKHADIADKLPNIARELGKTGYDTYYYYGGDINFTNQLGYLKSGGFENIVSDTDFPVGQRISKWGVNDGHLFERAASDFIGTTDSSPRFVVIQTSSSHEPFDVPMERRHSEAAANAFIYTDSIVGQWIDSLNGNPANANSLIVLVPDHYGAWPKDLSFADRHRVPLIITGGALAHSGRIEKVASQKDIAATLAALVGADTTVFPLSRNILSADNPGAAFFSEPDMAAYVDADANVTEISLNAEHDGSDTRTDTLKGFIQTLYRYAGSLKRHF